MLPASHCKVLLVLHGKDEMNILLVIDIIIFRRVNHSTKSDSIRHGIIIHAVSGAVKMSAAARSGRIAHNMV